MDRVDCLFISEKKSYFAVFPHSSPTNFPQTHSKGSIIFSGLFQNVTWARLPSCFVFSQVISCLQILKKYPFCEIHCYLYRNGWNFFSLDFDLKLAISTTPRLQPSDAPTTSRWWHCGVTSPIPSRTVHSSHRPQVADKGSHWPLPNVENLRIMWVQRFQMFSENNLKGI